MAWQVSIGTNLYRGYELDVALNSLQRCGARYVDLDFLGGLEFEETVDLAHVTEQDLDAPDGIRNMLAERDLQVVTFSGHMDLSREENLPLYFRKMEFAAALSIRVIGAFSGPVERKTALLKNLERVGSRAEDLNLIVALETESPGDVVFCGRAGAEVLAELDSTRIGLCYDTGNIYYANAGRIDLVEDLGACRNLVRSMHCKDAYWEGSWYRYGAVGEGIFDYAAISEAVRAPADPIPLTVEIPYYLKSQDWKPFTVEAESRPLEELERMVRTSLVNLGEHFPLGQ